MSELIFHHYDSSPFSEKIRLVFGIKGLAWSSVEIPNMLPRPDLMPLCGGYRKTPVLQIGADIYCDTQLILRELERRYPAPSLIPRGNKGIGAMVGFWADRPFFLATAGMFIGTLGPHLPDAFIKDREHFSAGRLMSQLPVLRCLCCATAFGRIWRFYPNNWKMAVPICWASRSRLRISMPI
jgi:glutathione S-transferase